ncbi:type II secretion system F family protein [Nocardioides pacificus]
MTLLLLGLVLLAIALTLAWTVVGSPTESGGVTRSLAVLRAMTTAPDELTADLDRSFSVRVLQPLQGRAVSLGRRLSGADTGERWRHKLDLAGNPAGWSIDRILASKVLGAVAGLVVSFLAAVLLGLSAPLGLLTVLGGTALGFFAVNLWLYQLAYDRAERMQRELPDAVDLLTICVESGLGFDAALQQVARHTEGPLAEELARVLQEMQLGQGRATALRGLAERSTVADLRSLVSALVQAESFGIPIGQVLRVQTGEMRLKRRQRAEEKAQKVPVKMTFPLVLFILPTLFVAVLGPAIISLAGQFG